MLPNMRIKVSNIFKDICNEFENFDTEYRRLKYLENLETFVKPSSYLVGTATSLNKIDASEEPTLSIKNVYGQKICLKTILKKFSELPRVLSKILLKNKNKILPKH